MPKVIVHNPGMTAARLKARFWAIAPQLGEVIKGDCNEFVRMQTGALKNSARVEDGGHSITWNTRYAKRVYYTGSPRTNVNPNASLRWCEKGKAAYAADWGKTATEMVRG